MRVKEKQKSALRPVHPRSVQHHGLFGTAFLRQHMMIDEHWTSDSLTQEFTEMTLLLKKHAQFHRLEKRVHQKQMANTYFSLQKECREGRSHLKLLRAGGTQQVRNILKDHRHMQRLYQKMPLHLVEDNINQRTFVMRKERDRLKSRLHQLEEAYNAKLIEKGNLENRISFENEFKLEEAAQIEDLKNKLEKSKLRLRACATINSTYRKIVEVLRHDEIFYVPILRSLDADMQDQSQFIHHILHLGSPALDRFKELSEQYKLLDDKARKSTYKRMREFSTYRKKLAKPPAKESKQSNDIYYNVTRYVRETGSMLDLQEKYEEIEDVIKKIKLATICSNEKDIYRRIKSQDNNNSKMVARLQDHMFAHETLETKLKTASVLQGVLIHNLNEDELRRLNRIKQLKEAIKNEDKTQEETLLYLKSRANVFILLRYFLWNLHDIMAHVGPRKIPRIQYPVDYLKLPLLKFEMLEMRVYPPDSFEQNISTLFNEVHAKLERLCNVFNWDLVENSLSTLKASYCNDMLSAADMELQSGHAAPYQIDLEPEMDIMEEARSYRTILSRSQIKLASARLVEECIKKDE